MRLGPSGLGDHFEIGTPLGSTLIHGVMIETQNELGPNVNQYHTGQYAIDTSIMKATMKLKPTQEDKFSILRAASMGRRIICNNDLNKPEVMNLRPAEQISSPKRHHEMQLSESTPPTMALVRGLQAKTLEERTRETKYNQMRNLTAQYGRKGGKLKLKDFRAMQREMMNR